MMGKCGLEWCDSGEWKVVGFCEHNDEHLCSI